MDADAVVIGAGAAGLAAAASLGRLGLHAIVLEGRDRVGGRVLSQPHGRALVPAELGAEFIHGVGTETLALLRDAGSTSVDAGGASWTFSGGRLMRDDEMAFGAAIFDGASKQGEDETVDRFLRRFDGDAVMRERARNARAFVEGFDAADPAIASARGIADEWKSGVDDALARPLGGYPPVFARLRADCAEAGIDVRLNARVRGVAWQRGAVVVETTDAGGAERTVRARAAIVTLPAGVLRDDDGEAAVRFDPVLPPAKHAALRYVVMGHVVKVTLRFRSDFWTRIDDGRYRDAAFFRAEHGPFPTYWTQYPVRSEAVAAWAGGPKAIALAGMSLEERIDAALTGFAALFGASDLARAEFVDGATHDWSRDPFARGAYSYLAVGGSGARAALAAPVDDTLFFAGEATANDGQGGTVNGALATGERAAREAAAALGTLISGPDGVPSLGSPPSVMSSAPHPGF